jgi:hypothetical protein
LSFNHNNLSTGCSVLGNFDPKALELWIESDPPINVTAYLDLQNSPAPIFRMDFLCMRSYESGSTISVIFSDDGIDNYNNMATHCHIHLHLNQFSESCNASIGRTGVGLCELVNMSPTTVNSAATEEDKKAYVMAFTSRVNFSKWWEVLTETASSTQAKEHPIPLRDYIDDKNTVPDRLVQRTLGLRDNIPCPLEVVMKVFVRRRQKLQL